MKTPLRLLLLLSLFVFHPGFRFTASAAPFVIEYDAGSGDPNPASRGWTAVETTAPGTDADGDGRIDPPANVGPITGAAGIVWQTNDSLAADNLNNPAYLRTLNAAAYTQLYEDGWEFEFTVRTANAAPGWSGFSGWTIPSGMVPGWNVAAGTFRRVGFIVGYDAGGNFWVRTDTGIQKNFGPGTATAFHTIRAIGQPRSGSFQWFVDGVSQGTIDLGDIAFPGSNANLSFTAGSSAELDAVADWKSVRLRSLPGTEIVIDSDAGTLSVNGVNQNGTFRGVAYTATVYNGLARFLFGGDLTLTEDDLLAATGRNAVSLSVAGDLTIADGAVVDVSAWAAPGPGGGAGGEPVNGGAYGTGGNGGGGGGGGPGGDGVGARFGWLTQGDWGESGDWGSFGDYGLVGSSGPTGRRGDDGFNAPNTGGAGTSSTNRGVAGNRGSRSTSNGSGGRGGWPQNFESDNGTSASAAGSAGGVGGAGGTGSAGGGGKVLRMAPGLTGGGGGASGQGGGGGGGAGGGGGGAGGGGGGGGGSDSFTGGRDGYDGRGGGHGGKGGRGGAGGASGAGGPGGGAIEFICYGTVNTGGRFLATGGAGLEGVAGETGKTDNSGRTNGGAATGRNTGSGFDGGAGGGGSNGGNGGSGGSGGSGGTGGGGAGGTVRIVAATASRIAGSFLLEGGTGNGTAASAGQHGRAILAANAGDFTGDVPASLLELAPGLRALNSHLHTFAETPYIPGLANGSDIAGLLDNTNAWTLNLISAGTPANARAAVMRMNSGPAGYAIDFPGYDFVLLANLTPEPLNHPVLGSGPNAWTAKLRDGGLAKNPVFGGSGATILDAIPPYGVYATLVPESVAGITFGFTPQHTLEFTSGNVANGGVRYLSFGGAVTRSAVAATDYPDPVITLPSAGAVVNFTFTGEVRVNIEPPEAAATAGVGWSLDGLTPVYPGGATAADIPVGPQTIRFTQVPGWLPPRAVVVAVAPGGGSPTTVTATYTAAPVYEVGSLAPQSVRGGDTLGFYVAPGTIVQVSSGSAAGPVFIDSGGWFSYVPDDADRKPFELTFTGATMAQTITVTPKQDLPPEQEIIALRPQGNNLPNPAGRDYNEIHRAQGSAGMNFNAAAQSRIVTISGKQVVFDAAGDRFFHDAVHGNQNIQELRIYAEEVIFRSVTHVPQAKVTIYARDLRFEGPNSRLDTTPVPAAAGTAGLPGGDISLCVLNIVSDPSSAARLTLHGGTSPNMAGGNSGLLSTPFAGMSTFADVKGGAGTPEGNAQQPVVHASGGALPVSYCWLHPISARAALNYAKDIYYLGFMTEAGAQFLEYERLLGQVATFDPLPELPDASAPALQFSELAADATQHVERIADKLDYFGNPAGWVPLLSFETNFLLTDAAITRAMDTLYLSHWLSRSDEYLQADLSALNAAQAKLEEENTALRNEVPSLQNEIDELEDKESEIDGMISDLQTELLAIEERMRQRATEIVDDRNNVPFWKKALRGAASIMQVIPVYQPALGAIGGGLDVVSRVDEQDALTTIVQGATVAGNYRVATLKGQANELEQKINPPVFGPPTEDEANRQKLLDQAANIETGLGALNSGAEVLRSFLQKNEAPKDGIDAELAKIRESDPQFNGVVDRIVVLLEEKQLFAARLASAQNRLREIPGVIMKNALAAERLNNSAFELGGILDPQALSVVSDNARRAKDRLRKHFYLLAKSFEYRMLEPYRENGQQAYDPVDVFDKIVLILEAAQSRTGNAEDVGATNTATPHVLNASGFSTLRSVFQEELQRLADRIIADYSSRGSELSQSPATAIPIPASLLPGINGPERQGIFNFAKLGFLAPGSESHRIADLDVNAIDFQLTLDGVPTTPAAAGLFLGSVDIDFIHSGISKLTRGGQTYVFNHFRNGDPDDNPIQWKFKVNLVDGSIQASRPSFASQSLLTALLGQNGTLDIQRFSRPGAGADLAVVVRNLSVSRLPGSPPGEIGILIDGIDLDFTIDYYPSAGTPEIEIAVADIDNVRLDIRPRFFFDAPGGGQISDVHGRRDGLGGILRSFDAGAVEITPEMFYGNNLTLGNAMPAGYRFRHWLGQSGAIITATPNALGDRATGQVLRVNNSVNKRFTAVYEFTGDRTPAEVSGLARNAAGSSGTIEEYLVTFSEPVVGVDAGDFGFEGIIPRGGTAPRILSVSGSGAVRTVVVDTGGTAVRLALLDDDSIMDFGGNSLAGDGSGNGDFEFTGDTVSLAAALRPLAMTPAGFQLEITATPNVAWKVQASADARSWSTIGTVTPPGAGPLIFTDTAASGYLRRFYRVAP